MRISIHMRYIIAIIMVVAALAPSLEYSKSTPTSSHTSVTPFDTSKKEPFIFTQNVKDNLKRVFHIGKEVGHPETLQAILLQETLGGKTLPVGNRESPVGKRSYGLMQVQVVAARSVLTRYPKIFERYFPGRKYKNVTDEEIIALLLVNDDANIRIAAYHFKIYITLTNQDWEKAVAAYNTGIGGVEKLQNYVEFDYVVKVKQHLNSTVKEFNTKHNLLT